MPEIPENFAQVDDHNVVVKVLVVAPDQAVRGEEYLRDDLRMGGMWIRATGRVQQPAPGMAYDPVDDVFVGPQPFLSWTRDPDGIWQPPVPYPADAEQGLLMWSEAEMNWIEQRA